ncbi:MULTISPECIES: glycosyltransferase [Peribacillus]|uniref:glycosyltransferase n=1 Tax=Peribacillus TaxID=2675229 RepID=UPI001F4DB950|nr:MULTISPECIES: glycosyltransferase [unclassified Peribacillus]MCK1981939.1 glycosyltransferase [Peribacillus sp. Aquil_B1]MCK2010017.1 glycosyltransferase [Peribacillus sp. Aquil_B8]
MNSLVSVLMTTYNEDISWIKESIDSILLQSYKKIELIIVVDNPNNYEVINFLEEYNRKFKNMKVIINDDNIGLALSLNKAYTYSKGIFIARMDADDISNIKRIEKQVEVLMANPEVGLVASTCVKINESGQEIDVQKVGYKTDRQIKKGLKYINFLVHPSWLMRRSVFEKLKGYRNFECSQDYDFLLRMITSDYKILLIDEKLIQYRVRANSITISKAFKQHLIAEYIKMLYLERKKNKQDSFSIKKLESYLNENNSPKKSEEFLNSQLKIEELKRSKKIFVKFSKMLSCLFYSSYSRKLLLNVLFFKLSSKL